MIKIILNFRQANKKPAKWRVNPLIDSNTPMDVSPLGKHGNFKLTFSDEFQSKDIDLNRWNIIDGHRGIFKGKTAKVFFLRFL